MLTYLLCSLLFLVMLDFLLYYIVRILNMGSNEHQKQNIVLLDNSGYIMVYAILMVQSKVQERGSSCLVSKFKIYVSNLFEVPRKNN